MTKFSFTEKMVLLLISFLLAVAGIAMTLNYFGQKSKEFDANLLVDTPELTTFSFPASNYGNEFTEDRGQSSFMYRSESALILPDFPGTYMISVAARNATVAPENTFYPPPGLKLNDNPESLIDINRETTRLVLGWNALSGSDTIRLVNDFWDDQTEIDVNLLADLVMFQFDSDSIEVLTGDEIVVSWSPGTDPDLFGFWLDFNVPPFEKRFFTTASDTAVHIFNLPTDYYQFSIVAVDSSGNVSRPAQSRFVYIENEILPPAPKDTVHYTLTITYPDSNAIYPFTIDFKQEVLGE